MQIVIPFTYISVGKNTEKISNKLQEVYQKDRAVPHLHKADDHSAANQKIVMFHTLWGSGCS